MNTGRLATIPKALSKILLSCQLVRVGNKVDRRIFGGGRSLDGHHFGVFDCSINPNGSFGYTDSGDALGERGRRLGGLDKVWADQGKSVNAGKGVEASPESGTATLRLGGRARSRGSITGDDSGLGDAEPWRSDVPPEPSASGGASLLEEDWLIFGGTGLADRELC